MANLALLLLWSVASQAAWQPEKSITLVAPSSPGGGWDQTARFLQHSAMTNQLSPVSIEVVNRGGAGGTIGLAELVDRYTGDASRLMITGSGMNGAVVLHDSKYGLTDGNLIARLTSEYLTFGVPADSPFKTLDDLIAALKADPKSVSIGGGAAGGADQIFAALFLQQVGMPASSLSYVAFTGGGEVSAALMGKQVPVAVSGYSEWGGLVDAGRVRLLAISSPERLPGVDLPTLKELGVDLDYELWRGVMAPPGLTGQQQEWYVNLMAEVQATQTWQDILAKNDWQDTFLTGPELEQFVIAEHNKIQNILQSIGLGAGGEGYAVVGPYFFPKAVGIALLICVLFMAWPLVRSGRSMAYGAPWLNAFSGEIAQRFGIAVLLLVIYVLMLRYVGFWFATPLMLTALSRLIGSRALLRDFGVSIGLTLFMIYVFKQLLTVDIP